MNKNIRQTLEMKQNEKKKKQFNTIETEHQFELLFIFIMNMEINNKTYS